VADCNHNGTSKLLEAVLKVDPMSGESASTA
jgi:hypothetical protein